MDALAKRDLLDDFVATLTPRERIALDTDWAAWARTEQWTDRADWTTWLLLGGRGSGKTRAGAEYVQALACGRAPNRERAGHIALVAETHGDAREVMVEGESGLLAIARPGERPTWTPSRRRVEWPSGAVAYTFSSEDPDGLRGPQFAAAWCDELAKWRHAEATWDNLQFALRLGARPCQVVTTTPRNTPLLRRLLADDTALHSRMRTSDNERMLAPSFMAAVAGRYEGTRLGRQELDGELLEDRAGALWRRDELDRGRVRDAPPLGRIVVGVDPPVTGGRRSDACGIVVVGTALDGATGFVLADRTVESASPTAWAEAVVRAARDFEADRVVAETNQGGDLVEEVLRAVPGGAALPIRQVRATRGKHLRAEPVAALYERGRVLHRGALPALEDEMCDFAPIIARGAGREAGAWGLSGGRSPDRLDALVWALTDLMLGREAEPRARFI